jgi:tripartite-type tricarboxylate transporter receptor subunit TctC
MKTALGAALATVAVLAGAAQADPVEDFYRGKQITMILSAGAGGGYAQYAHAFAPYFQNHIPGKPNIVVTNMPGAGGIRAMLHFATNAAKDGTILGLVHSSVPFAPLYGIEAAKYDPRQFNWIGSINATTAICVSWTESGVTKWDDLFTEKFIVGGTGAGSQMETMPAMINKLFGTKIKIISGYTGGADVYLAMERGEVTGRCGGLVSSIESTRPDWFPKRKVSVPIQVAMERAPMFPDVPAISEFAKDEKTRQILQLTLAPLEMDRPILAPPGTPQDRVDALRKAFHATMTDQAFIDEANRQHLETREVTGERLAKILDDAFSLRADVVKAATEAMNLTGSGGGGEKE